MQNKKRHLIGMSILISSAIISGILLGSIYLNFFYEKPTNYGQFNQSDLSDDEASIIARFGNSDITTLSTVNAFIIAEYKSRQQETITIKADGKIDTAMAKQTIYTTRYLDFTQGRYYVENISAGKKIMGIDSNIAERNYYDTQSGVVSVYQGSNVRETSANFNMDKPNQTMTLEEWKDLNGTTPTSFHPYIVSTQTVKSDDSTPTACVLDDGSDGYTFQLSLNYKAAVLYVKQMKNLSKLPKYPNFEYINIDVYLNADGTFNKIVCNEKYTVNMGFGPIATVSKLTYHFTNNDVILIPDIDTKEGK